MDELYSSQFLSKLDQIAESGSSRYATADPFPHIVIDDFFPEVVLQRVVDAFPPPRQVAHREYRNEREIKLQYNAIEVLPQLARDVLHFLNSSPMMRFLERLTGIGGLIPDPHLSGGGLHQIERGGKLDVHADFNWLDDLRLDRRLNLLVYLNRDWKDEYGGHLELWDRSMTRCAARVMPIFNRCVVFSTTDDSFHGHPDPLNCPEGWSRRSIATYYYTNGRPEEERSEAHSTLFVMRPADLPSRRRRMLRRAKRVVRALLPPIVTDAYRYLRISR